MLVVIAFSQLVGLAAIVVWLVASDDPRPPDADLLAAVGAGAAGVVGIAALYRGLAIGAMAIVAPISALSPVVALVADVVNGKAPGAVDLAGIAILLGGILVLSRGEPGGTRLAAGIVPALVAALGFGLYAIGLDAAADESVVWAVSVARGTATVIAVVAIVLARAPAGRVRSVLPLVVAVGIFDTLGNVFLAAASTRGLISIVDALAAMYPVVTVTLAIVILKERPRPAQLLAGATAIGGAALIAVS